NRVYLQTELLRLRLLFQRKVRWLRSMWRQDPLGPGRGVVISDTQADRQLAGEDLEAEMQFYREGLESVEIGRRIDLIQAELERQRMPGKGELPAVEMLARKFSLKGFERDVLLLCWSLEEDPAFSQLCAYVQDDAQARFVTPHVALALLSSEP